MDDLVNTKLLIPREVAEILGVSRTQIYRLLRTQIPVHRVGKSTICVLPIDLKRYLVARRDANDQTGDQSE
jgi:excisionase family DNA binding protein